MLLLMSAPTAHSKPLEHDAVEEPQNHQTFFSKTRNEFFYIRRSVWLGAVVVNEMKRARVVCVSFSWNED
jgi:hypothetical protein